MRIIILATTVIFLSGCASTYTVEHLTAVETKLSRGKTVIIATPENGVYETTEYMESGRMTAMAVNSAFSRYATPTISTSCSSLKCLQNDNVGYDYYVVPTILHWEDQATEWSGKLDRLEVKLYVYDGSNFSELSSTIISGKSKWASLGGDHPQDLLPEPVGKYVDSLF